MWLCCSTTHANIVYERELNHFPLKIWVGCGKRRSVCQNNGKSGRFEARDLIKCGPPSISGNEVIKQLCTDLVKSLHDRFFHLLLLHMCLCGTLKMLSLLLTVIQKLSVCRVCTHHHHILLMHLLGQNDTITSSSPWRAFFLSCIPALDLLSSFSFIRCMRLFPLVLFAIAANVQDNGFSIRENNNKYYI